MVICSTFQSCRHTVAVQSSPVIAASSSAPNLDSSCCLCSRFLQEQLLPHQGPRVSVIVRSATAINLSTTKRNHNADIIHMDDWMPSGRNEALQSAHCRLHTFGKRCNSGRSHSTSAHQTTRIPRENKRKLGIKDTRKLHLN